MLYIIVKILLYIPIKLLYPTGKIASKKLPKGNYVFVCNHFSALDIPVLMVNLNYNLNFVAKKELFKNRILAALFTSAGASPIDRQNLNLSSMKVVINKLKKGKSILLFPEGTRNKKEVDKNFDDIKNGASMFSIFSGTPIVPLMLSRKPKIFRKNKLIIGEPIDLCSMVGKKATKQALGNASEILKENMEKLKRQYSL